jgi:hypothetical protein
MDPKDVSIDGRGKTIIHEKKHKNHGWRSGWERPFSDADGSSGAGERGILVGWVMRGRQVGLVSP